MCDPPAAWANCTNGTNATTCDTTAPNPYTLGIGNGTQNSYTVTVNGGTSTSTAAQISAGNAEAIAINNGGTINIGNYASVINTATSGGGPTGTGFNTIDFNSNTTMTIGVGATVASNGTAPTAEAINPRGTGNTIINNGLILGIPSFAIYFESGSSTNTVINNATGIIRSTHGAIGGNPGANTIFVNYGLVDGNLVFLGKNDQLTLYTGSQITGSLKGGGGADSITLAGAGSQALPGSIQGFATLKKIDTGSWTLNGTITGNLNVDVNQGTLNVNGNNSGFTGSIVVDSAGTLAGLAASLPPSVTDNGQVLFTQTTDGVYAGLISGTGGVTKSGGSILKLTNNETYSGGTTVSAGELQLGGGGTTGSVVGNIVDNAILSFNRSDVNTFGGVVSGAGVVKQIGAGTTILTAANTYTGGTVVDTGVLQLGNNGTSGSITGNVTVNGNGALSFDRSDVVTFPGVISGAGQVSQIGSGTTILTGANTYTSKTTISNGVLQLGNGGTSGSIAGDATDNALLVFNRSDNLLYSGTITGTGALTQAGTGMLTLTSDSSFTGNTTIAAGTLQLGNGAGSAGSVAGNIIDNGALIFNHDDDITYAKVISGTGSLTQNGSDVLTLTGANTYTGSTVVNTGKLRVDGSVAGNVQVNANAILGGSGSIGGAVTIANSGHLAPGDSPGTLTVGSLTLNSGSQLDYEFGQPNIVGSGINDLTNVTGNLTLAGTLNIANLGGFGDGVYRVFNYGGALTNNGLAFGTLPTGFTPTDMQIQTSVPNQVNLIVAAGGFSLQFWDGTHTVANGAVDGGTASWDTTTTNWTTASGSVNAPWSTNGFAVFEGTAGTVTLAQNITFSGMQFLSNGYVVQGNGFSLAAAPATVIRVDPGLIATINAPIVDGTGGAASLTKSDGGTLILSGANTYSGGTAINGGTLQISSDGNLGASSGALSLDTGTLATTTTLASARHVTLNAGGGSFAPVSGATLTLSGLVDGSGTLTKSDAGTLLLTGTNTYSGGTVLNQGVLGVSADANLGNASGLLDFTGGTLQFESSFNLAGTRAITLDLPGGTIDTLGNSTTIGQVINGNGSLGKQGSGTLVLTGNNTYDGNTTIGAGSLQIGNGATSGSIGGNVLDNGVLVFDRSDTLTYPGSITGSGALVQAGTGTTVLTGANSYTGGTTISAGTLQISDGGTLGSIVDNVTNNGALIFNHADNITFGGSITGTGTLAQNGDGTLTITGTVNESGATTINAGTLSIGNGVTDGSVLTNIVDNSALVFNRSSTTYGNVISGTGTVQQLSSGNLILTGANTYSGLTTITAGSIQVGNGGTAGSLGTGNVLDNAALIFDRSDSVTYAGAISGTGGLTQAGGGTLVLTGNSTYTGATALNAGVLLVNGSLGNTAVSVASGTTLGGAGIIGGPVTVNGGTVAPGAQLGQAGVLSVAGLALSATSQLNFDLAMPNVIGTPNDLINDTGNLALNGVLNVNDTGQFASTPGSYRLINYDGTLSGAGLSLGTIPGGANEAVVQTSVPNQVNLIKYINGLPVQFWDGVSASSGNSLIDGGNGVWNNSDYNWTNVTGNINQSWIPGMAIFTAAAGTVTLGEPVSASALQFLTDGYRIEGNGNVLTLFALPTGAPPLIRVDPGVTATIDAVLAGSSGLEKGDPGTLVLSQDNTYTGGTTISSGTLQLGAGGTSGSILGDVANNGTLAFDRSDSYTFAGLISGAGSVTQLGSGTTVLVADNTYTGGTTISAGVLQLGNGGTSGSIVGDVIDNGNLTFNRSDTSTESGVISGTGSVTQAGTGTTILTGNSTYTGGTTISAGVLQLGNGGTSGSIVGDVTDNGTLAFNRADTVTFPGVVSGTGSLAQTGSGTTVLTGDNSYTGGTSITAGTLQLGDGGTSGAITGDVSDNGTLSFNRSDSVTFAGVVSGSGQLVQSGSGTVVLTADNTYSGGTTITAGTLQLGSGGTSGSIAGDVTDNGSLVFNRSDTVTYAGVISGTGQVSQAGSGTTVLTGASTYTGGTSVDAGNLELDGSLTSDIVVQNGATLSGIGSTTGSVTNFGLVAPDPPAVTGSLLIGGDYSGQGGVLLIKSVLNAGGPGNQTTDRLLVEGNAVGVTPVTVQPLSGGVPSMTGNSNTSGISIVQVGGNATSTSFQLSGGFVASGPYEMRLYVFPKAASAASEIDSRLASAGVTAVTDYRLQVPVVEPTTLQIVKPLTSGPGTPGAPGAPGTPPPTQITPPITADVTTGGFTTAGVFVPAGLPVGEGPNGEAPGTPVVLPQVPVYRAAATAALDYGYMLVDELHKRLGDIEQSAQSTDNIETFARYNYWSGSLVNQQVSGVDQDMWFMQVGGGWVGRSLAYSGDQLHLDITGSLGNSHLDDQVNGARTSFRGQSIGFTATYMAARGWYVDAVLQNTNYQNIRSTTLQQGIVDNFGGHGFITSLEGGYPFTVAGTVIEPRASVAYQDLSFDHSVDLDQVSFQLHGDHSLVARGGVRAEHPFVLSNHGPGYLVSPYLTLDYVHDFDSGRQEGLGNVDFATASVGSALRFGGGVTAQLGPSWNLYLSYERSVARGGRGSTGNEGQAGVRFTF